MLDMETLLLAFIIHGDPFVSPLKSLQLLLSQR